ncbi:MAG: NAD-binding protein [bacterium]|nr:NAD-binding protein [bacterium]
MSRDNRLTLGKHAVVVGGSVIGLMAARVLADYYESVTVIERDGRPEGPEPRRGSPQGWHTHVLLDKGREILADLFPGIFPELEELGALRADSVSDLAWYHHGVWKARGKADLIFYLQSRPLLEWHVRNRVAQDCPSVKFEYGCDVQGLILDSDRKRIKGVHIRRHKPLRTEELMADFVADASGRGSKFPRWLGDAGFDFPHEDQVKINIGYTTCLYQQTEDPDRDWVAMMIYPRAPDRKLGYIYPIEPDARGKQRWIVTMTGCFGDHAPMEHEGFLDHARNLSRPDIYNTIRGAKPISNYAAYKFPASRRVRYENCRNLPEGFAVMGDALCSFNPIYGQGMSVGAMAVRNLQLCLEKGAKNITRRYFRRASWAVSLIPWFLATSEDFRYREAVGKRPFGLGIVHWYVGTVHKLSGQDVRVYAEFLKVLHFISTPLALFKPYFFLRVLARTFGFYKQSAHNAEREYVRLPAGTGLQAQINRRSKPSVKRLSKKRLGISVSKKKKTTKKAARGRAAKKKTTASRRKTKAANRK